MAKLGSSTKIYYEKQPWQVNAKGTAQDLIFPIITTETTGYPHAC